MNDWSRERPKVGNRTNDAMGVAVPRLSPCVLLLSPLLLTACHDRASAKDFTSWCWQNQNHGDVRKGSRWLIYKFGMGPQAAEGPILLRPYLCANVTAVATFARPRDEAAIRDALRRSEARSENKMFALAVRANTRATRGPRGDYSVKVDRLESVDTPTPSEQEYLFGRFDQAGAFDAYTDNKDGTRRPMPSLR